jgi:hypothetical protein
LLSDEDKWKTEARTEGGAIQEYTISYQNLVPSTSYTFRVIAYNKYGISYPAKSQASVSCFLSHIKVRDDKFTPRHTWLPGMIFSSKKNSNLAEKKRNFLNSLRLFSILLYAIEPAGACQFMQISFWRPLLAIAIVLLLLHKMRAGIKPSQLLKV